MELPPEPPKETSTGEDNATLFLNEWKRLFNNIDPERIVAYSKGDKEFKEIKRNFEHKAIRLDGVCNTNLQLVVCIESHFPHLTFSPGTIMFCLQDEAYATDWIRELDENLDKLILNPVSWEFVYDSLVSETSMFKNRIPKPPKN